MKKYIVTEEFLRDLIDDRMHLLALEKGKVYDWSYYNNSIYDFIVDCSREDGVEYSNMTQIVEAEMAKLEPLKEGDII